jgi:hypothetical protein
MMYYHDILASLRVNMDLHLQQGNACSMAMSLVKATLTEAGSYTPDQSHTGSVTKQSVTASHKIVST